MKGEVKTVFYNNSTILEGPEWNKERRCISCVSIIEGCVYIIYEETGDIKTINMGGQVGCALWIDSDHLLVASYNGIFKVNVDTGERVFIVNFLSKDNIRYNDGTLDKNKRLIVGTTGYNCYAYKENALYSYCNDQAIVLVDKTTISNGIAFSPNSDYMYFVDTPTHKIGRYCYDLQTGKASFDRYVVSIEEGIPDGICTDSDGNLWVAHWGGFQVSKWDTCLGKCIDFIKLPCKNVSSCCIGGKKMDYLYITTAKHDDGTDSEDLAGALFKVHINN